MFADELASQMQTVGNCGTLLVFGAAYSLPPISPGSRQEPPAITYQLVREYTFFPSDLKLLGGC